MSLFNAALWNNILPGDTGAGLAEGSLDTTQVIDGLLPDLHAGSRADLTFWSPGELIRWMDECLKRLSRIACVFVGRDAATLTVAGQAAYSLPTRHVATLHMSYLATPLRPSNMAEIEAWNPAFQSAQGTPDHWYADHLGSSSVALAPVPDTSDDVLPIIYEGWPEELDAGGQNTLVAAPAPLKAYLAMYVLAEAYGQESEAEMPDVAAHCRGRLDLYHQIFQTYYGKGM